MKKFFNIFILLLIIPLAVLIYKFIEKNNFISEETKETSVSSPLIWNQQLLTKSNLATPAVPVTTPIPSNSTKKTYVIVKCDGPISRKTRDAIAATGSFVYKSLPKFSFLVQTENMAELEKIDAIEEISAYGFNDIISSPLRERIANEPTETSVVVLIRVFGSTENEAVLTAIKNLGGEIQQRVNSTISAKIKLEDCKSLAEIYGVEKISERPVLVTQNNKIYNGDFLNLNVVTEKFARLNGAGEIIGCSDTGLDSGINETGKIHKDLEGQILRAVTNNWTTLTTWQDYVGHGSHVVGTLLGTGKARRDMLYHGMADGAKLFFQPMSDSQTSPGDLMIPGDAKLFPLQAYYSGARIYSMSWGAPGEKRGFYGDSFTKDFDEMAFNYPEFLMCIAAGNYERDNNGVYTNGIYSTACGKNVIAVGNLATTNSVNGSSCRGYTEDGRFKPDLTTHGTDVNSILYLTTTGYTIKTGTSMATPAISGTAGILRQYLREYRKTSRPSASLLRALLYASCSPISSSKVPNAVEGYGSVNAANIISPTDGVVSFYDWLQPLETDEVFSFDVTTTEPGNLSAVLAWTDFAGDSLINDLNLSIVYPNGSTTNLSDSINTSEKIVLENIPAGKYQILVKAANISTAGSVAALVIKAKTETANPAIIVPDEVQSEQYSLTIESPDTNEPLPATPAVGTHTIAKGQTVTAKAFELYSFIGTSGVAERIGATGYVLKTGSSTITGNVNSVTFTMTDNATLTWQTAPITNFCHVVIKAADTNGNDLALFDTKDCEIGTRFSYSLRNGENTPLFIDSTGKLHLFLYWATKDENGNLIRENKALPAQDTFATTANGSIFELFAVYAPWKPGSKNQLETLEQIWTERWFPLEKPDMDADLDNDGFSNREEMLDLKNPYLKTSMPTAPTLSFTPVPTPQLIYPPYEISEISADDDFVYYYPRIFYRERGNDTWISKQTTASKTTDNFSVIMDNLSAAAEYEYYISVSNLYTATTSQIHTIKCISSDAFADIAISHSESPKKDTTITISNSSTQASILTWQTSLDRFIPSKNKISQGVNPNGWKKENDYMFATNTSESLTRNCSTNIIMIVQNLSDGAATISGETDGTTEVLMQLTPTSGFVTNYFYSTKNFGTISFTPASTSTVWRIALHKANLENSNSFISPKTEGSLATSLSQILKINFPETGEKQNYLLQISTNDKTKEYQHYILTRNPKTGFIFYLAEQAR